MSCYDGARFTTYTAEDGLGNNTVQAIGVDHRGEVWFGTWGGGVSSYTGARFANLTVAEGLAGNNAWATGEDG